MAASLVAATDETLGPLAPDAAPGSLVAPYARTTARFTQVLAALIPTFS